MLRIGSTKSQARNTKQNCFEFRDSNFEFPVRSTGFANHPNTDFNHLACGENADVRRLHADLRRYFYLSAFIRIRSAKIRDLVADKMTFPARHEKLVLACDCEQSTNYEFLTNILIRIFVIDSIFADRAPFGAKVAQGF